MGPTPTINGGIMEPIDTYCAEQVVYKDQCRPTSALSPPARSPTFPQTTSAIKIGLPADGLRPPIYVDQPSSAMAETLSSSHPERAMEPPTTYAPIAMAEAQLVSEESALPIQEQKRQESAATPEPCYSKKWLCCAGVFLGAVIGGLVTAVVVMAAGSSGSSVEPTTDIVRDNVPTTVVSSDNVSTNATLEEVATVNDTVVLVGDVVSDFPIVIPYNQVQSPVALPFEVRGSFLVDPDTSSDVSGIVGHEQNCGNHVTCEGFKVNVAADGTMNCNVAQSTSYYNKALSQQGGLKDGVWHTFVCKVTEEFISVEVDGIVGSPAGTSDARGVQDPKLFGRVVHSGPYIIGDDPGANTSRRLHGQVKNVVIVSAAS